MSRAVFITAGLALCTVGAIAMVSRGASTNSSGGLVEVSREVPPLGINLAELAHYSTEYPFVDAFKTSAPFLHQTSGQWELDTPLELRADGYPARLDPGHIAGTLMFREMGTHYPAGDYICLYDGDGDLRFDFAAKTLRGQRGRSIVRVRPSHDGIYLKITRTNPADPVRNIRLIMPGFEETYREQPFHPDFLARWKGFGVLRFMDWQRTNDSHTVEWADRNSPANQTQAGPAGIAPEYVIALANTLGADPWICIPHRASDDFVREFARLCAANLASERTVWLEYSNEVWNGQFDQWKHARDCGIAAEMSADQDTAARRYYGQRSTEVFKLWREAFAADDRVVCVLGVQNSYPQAAREVLEWNNTWQHADALAVAPYFGNSLGDPALRKKVEGFTVAEILARCRVSLETAIQSAAVHGRTAQSYDLKLVAYEAGQHLAGYNGAENHQTTTELFFEANRSAEMGEIYAEYLRRWRSIGGETLVAFNSTQSYSKWGCWGLCENYGPDSESAPKYLALRALIDAR